MGPHGRPSISSQNDQGRWHGLAGRFGRQGLGGSRKNAARRWGGTVLAGVFSEGEAGHDGAWWPTAGFGVLPRWSPRGAARGCLPAGFLDAESYLAAAVNSNTYS